MISSRRARGPPIKITDAKGHFRKWARKVPAHKYFGCLLQEESWKTGICQWRESEARAMEDRNFQRKHDQGKAG